MLEHYLIGKYFIGLMRSRSFVSLTNSLVAVLLGIRPKQVGIDEHVDLELLSQSLAARVGKSLEYARTTAVGKLALPISLSYIFLKYRRRQKRLREFESVDIGIPGDSCDAKSTRVHRIQEFDRIATLSEADLSSVKRVGILGPVSSVMYVSGMPLNRSNNGYAIRKKYLIEYLNNIGCQVATTYICYTEVPSEERAKSYRFVIDSYAQLTSAFSQADEDLFQIVQRERPEVLIAGSNWLNGEVTRRVARRCGLPFVYDVRGLWHKTKVALHSSFENTVSFLFQERMEKSVMRQADVVLCISEQMAQFARIAGVEASRIYVCPNPAKPTSVDALGNDHDSPRTRLNLPQERPLVGFFGSVEDYERLDVVIRALAKFEKKNKRPLFCILGQGASIQPLKQLQAELGLHDDVIFLGQRPQSDVATFMAAMDILVFPRDDSEVFQLVPSLKAVEAMLSKRPIVFSAISPHLELAGGDQQRAYVVDSYKPDVWRHKISEALMQPQVNKDLMCERAYEWVLLNRSINTCFLSLGRILKLK